MLAEVIGNGIDSTYMQNRATLVETSPVSPVQWSQNVNWQRNNVSKLHYLIGDATEPTIKPAIICHVNNNLGGWGRGFVVALSAKYPAAEKAYRQWKLSHDAGIPDTVPFMLGSVQFVAVTDSVYVANMIAQHDVVWMNGVPPIRYGALEACLTKVYKTALNYGATVHMPRIGADLAGGEWSKIEDIIKKTMTVDSYVYTLKAQKGRWPTTYKNN